VFHWPYRAEQCTDLLLYGPPRQERPQTNPHVPQPNSVRDGADNSILDFVAAPEVLFTNNRKSGGDFPATINKCRTLLHGQGIGLAQQVPDAPPWTGHWTGSTSAVRPSMDWALDWLRAIRPSMDRALDWFRAMTTGSLRRVFNTFLNTILSPQWPSILTRDTHAASHNVTTKRL